MLSRTTKDGQGLWEQPLLSGAHICQIYLDEMERRDTLADFIGNGLRLGERTYCFSEQPADALTQELLSAYGLPVLEDRASGAYVGACNREIYLQDGVFDHERMFRLWQELYSDAMAKGYPGFRAIAELPHELAYLDGARAIILYETNVNRVLQQSPPTRVICQYDARIYDACAILGILKAHPLILVDRQVYANPFFAPPFEMVSH